MSMTQHAPAVPSLTRPGRDAAVPAPMGPAGAAMLHPNVGIERVARAETIVREAMELHPDLFPGSAFAGQVWDIRHRQSRATTGGGQVAFTLYGTNEGKNASSHPADAMPASVGNLLRAYVVELTAAGRRTVDNKILPQRLFWEYLTETDPARAEGFSWHQLAIDDLAGFEAWLHTARIVKRPKRRLASSVAQGNVVTPDDRLSIHGKPRSKTTRRGLMEGLLRWAEWLRGHKLLGALPYQIKTPDTRRLAKETTDGQRTAAADKLPPEEVIAALAAIYGRLIAAYESGEAVREDHVLLASLLAVQMLTGLRANELLTLPADCERWQQVRRIGRGIASTGPMTSVPLASAGADYRYGLAFWVEKVRQKRLWVRWISPTAEPIVRAAIARIRKLTQPARERAAVLARCANRVPLPAKYSGRDELTRPEVLEIFGLSDSSGSLNQGRLKSLPRTVRSSEKHRTAYFKRVDVEAVLQEMRDPETFMIRLHDGTVEPLETSLCVVPQNFFLRSPMQAPRALLVTKVMYNTYNTFLGGSGDNGRSGSIFAAYGTSEEIKTYRVNSHAFRHWLTSVAYAGGMPLDRLTLYFARVHGADTLDYVHPLRELSDEDLAGHVQEEIAAGRVFGDIALTYWSLPADPPYVRREYLVTTVRVGHVTPWGICLRDFAVEPCDKHLDCLNDCSHFCGTKGDPRQIEALEDLLWRTEELLRLAADATARGEDWGAGYLEHHQRRIDGIRAVLEFHRDPGTLDGTEAPVFGRRHSLPVLQNGRRLESGLEVPAS